MRGARSMPLHPPRELDGALEALGVRPGGVPPCEPDGAPESWSGHRGDPTGDRMGLASVKTRLPL
jgi:hypothetical protein